MMPVSAENKCFDTGTMISVGFPGGAVEKYHLPMQETRVRSLGQEDSPGGENGSPLQESCLENSLKGIWQATGQGIAKSWTQPSTHTHA